MTLKLALGGYLSERSAKRGDHEPPADGAEVEEPVADRDADRPDAAGPAGAADVVPDSPVAELAMAMGTVAQPTAVERDEGKPAIDEFAATELAVAELAMAMGALAEAPAVEAPPPEAPAVEGPPPEVPADDAAGGAEVASEDALAVRVPGEEPLAVDAPTEDTAVEDEATGDLATEDSPVEDALLGGAVAADPPGEAAAEALAGEARAPRVAVDLEQAVVAVFGLESAGLPAAIALRNAGARVIGVERSTSRLEKIASGGAELSRSEQDALRDHLSGRGFVLTDSVETLEAAEFVLICVPSAVDRERRPNLEMLKRACAAVVDHARPGQTIVLTSTTYVGSTRELLVAPLEERGLRVGEDVFVAFAPDRADPGVPEHGALRTPRVLGAVTERCYENASKLLRAVCSELRRVSSPEAAEMVKLYENTFRAVNIALAFEMADACRAHRLDPTEVTDAAATKPFGFMAHHPSAGVGGGCIGVDPHHLTQPLRGGGRPATITEEALRKLAARPRQVVWRAQELLIRSGRQLNDARVLVVGASYKPGIADTRQAPGVEILSRLQAEGTEVEYHDPLVPELQVGGESICSVDPDPRRGGSELGPEDFALAIIVTMHPGHDYGWLRRVPEVLDCTYSTPAGRRRFVP